LPKQTSRRQGENDDFMPYASAMITSLKTERDIERNAHRQMHQKSESRIAMLEAKLASREAELEACVAYSDASFRSLNNSYRSSQPAVPVASTSRITKVCETSNVVLPRKSGSAESARLQTLEEADTHFSGEHVSV
jgi:hypothetical protein